MKRRRRGPRPDRRPPAAVRRRYHPHLYGLVEDAMLGGASGLIVVQGVEQARPRPRTGGSEAGARASPDIEPAPIGGGRSPPRPSFTPPR